MSSWLWPEAHVFSPQIFQELLNNMGSDQEALHMDDAHHSWRGEGSVRQSTV